ncbi:hypothetical protein IAQ61_008137 [Plenodomus lingam]|uniref:uncharacterized protein n=1 Tax=Leptosphaeria maculans TaxID=5022 RepID=UPI00332874B8|nr:hypothetical protein IAQ61_008137 [Plenodomus lingam]
MSTSMNAAFHSFQHPYLELRASFHVQSTEDGNIFLVPSLLVLSYKAGYETANFGRTECTTILGNPY